jgi:misacylated tRNA(Ala) deacylase
MPTECLFRDDSYLKSCDARVVAITEQGGIVLDRTVFYATSGGQPGDTGTLTTADGVTVPIATAVYTDAAKSEIAHILAQNVPAPNAPALKVGDAVNIAVDWDKRYARMRMHTALHLLSAALPYAVTGGSVGESESRLDFDIPEAGLDKDAITTQVNAMIGGNAAVSSRWISDAELEANPGLVKTMSVKPPTGTGQVRLIEIKDLDLQPCGGTHVRSTAEIGAVRVTQVEKKGKLNRRVRLALV